MGTKREEKLEEELKICRQALRKEKQRNMDIQKSRDKYKLRNKELVKQQKEESLKKTRNSKHTNRTY